jgi:hypothetical protein
MSRHNVSRATNLFHGLAQLPGYQGGVVGIQEHPLYRWRPTNQPPGGVATPNASAARTITATAALAAGAAGCTLTGNWGGVTFLYPAFTSAGEGINVLLTNGSTAVKFYPANPVVSGTGSYGSTSPYNTSAPQYQLNQAATATISVYGLPPVVGVANAYAASQSVAANGSAVLNGTYTQSVQPSNPIIAPTTQGVPDVPRNVVAAWTGAAVMTVTGLDYWGQPQSEVSASGTAFTGKKTYSAILSVSFSAAVTAATVGFGNVLGLPFRVNHGDIWAAAFGDAADAGTFVAADLTLPATTSTGDVRGTYTPAGTLNGFTFLSALLFTDASSQVGAFGVTPT